MRPTLETRPLWTVTGLVLLAAVACLDALTKYEIELNLLYSLPALLVTWFTGWRLGMALAFVSALMLMLVRLLAGHPYSHWGYYVLNPALKFGVFATFVYLVSSVKKHLARVIELSRIDVLTGAVNRRYFLELMQVEMDRSRRYKHPYTVAYLDLDDFKALNDRFGHSTGDRVLQVVVEHIKDNLRKVDVVARLGGDEFALLLSETGPVAARAAVSKIQQGLLREMRTRGWPLTFSIGVFTCLDPPYSLDDIVRLTDECMYEVKRQGKNAVHYEVCEPSGTPAPSLDRAEEPPLPPSDGAVPPGGPHASC